MLHIGQMNDFQLDIINSALQLYDTVRFRGHRQPQKPLWTRLDPRLEFGPEHWDQWKFDDKVELEVIYGDGV